jgi:peptidoglycan/xylan/chitin deacetylase (PgdA/CDA1 family)
LRKWATTSPVSPEPVLRPAYWVAEKFKRSERFAKSGVRLLRTRKAIEMLRGARREAGSWKALHAEFGIRLPVLMYHHVGPAQPGTLPRLTISPDEFKRQVEWLAKNGYQGISARAWIEWCEQGTPLPPKPVLFTFDDAYEDIAKFALPVLERHRFSAVIFVVTQKLGTTNDWDTNLTPTRLPLMSAEQIVEWHRRGIEFGSHTRTHADLTASPELVSEIAGSKADLQRLLGESPECFAYPYGKYSEASGGIVAENYKLAFGVQQGVNNIKTDPYVMARTMVKPGESLLEFGSRVRSGRNRFETFLPGLRNRIFRRRLN